MSTSIQTNSNNINNPFLHEIGFLRCLSVTKIFLLALFLLFITQTISAQTIGEDWTLRSSGTSENWSSVVYGNGLFVAVSETGTGNRVMTSPDGITWTSQTSAADNGWYDITYGNGLFVAVAYTGEGNRVMTSSDGVTWTAQVSAADNDWLGVTSANGIFVAVSYDWTGKGVMTSGTFIPDTSPLTLSGSFTASNKTYDGLTKASVSAANLSLNGIESGDVVTIDSVKYGFANANAEADKVVSITTVYLGGANASDYSVNLSGAPTSTATISVKKLTIGGSFTANEKEYDRTNVATIKDETLALIGVVSGETVVLEKSARFNDEQPGENKAVSLAGSSISGDAAINYELDLAAAPTTKASIKKKAVTLSGTFVPKQKQYDGNVFAVTQQSSLEIAGLITYSGDQKEVMLVDSVFVSFQNAGAGNDKTVGIDSVWVSGADKLHYELSLVGSPTAFGVISKAPLTITALSKTISIPSTPFSGGFGVAYSGFVANEDSTSLSGALVYGGNSQGATTAGTYDIIVSGYTSDNYAITYVKGIVTISDLLAVVNEYPVNNATKVSIDNGIYADFNKNISLIKLDSISLKNSKGEAVTITPSVLDKRLLFNSADLAYNTVYTAKIGEAAVEESLAKRSASTGENEILVGGGAKKNQAFTWSFKTIMSKPNPVALSPTNGAEKVLVDTKISVKFDQAIQASGSGILVEVSPAGGSPILTQTYEVKDSTLIVTLNQNLAYSTSYSVNVKSGSVVNSDDIPNESISWNFTTVRSKPVVAGVSPANNGTGIAIDASIWVKFDQAFQIGNAAQISIKDDQNAAVSGISTQIMGDTLRIIHADLNYFTTYQVLLGAGTIVGTENDFGNDAYNWSFKTIIEPPAQVELLNPVTNAISVEQGLLFNWKKALRTTTYEWQLSENSSFSTFVDESNSLTDTSVTVGVSLNTFTEYFWRVRAANENGNGAWSVVSMFTTKPSKPTNTFPGALATEISTAPLLQWSGLHSGVRYELTLKADTLVSTVIIDTLLFEKQKQFYGLTDNTTYFWKTRVTDAKGVSDWTAFSSFTTRKAPEDVETEPVVVTFNFGNTSSTQAETRTAPEQTDYRMVSLPGTDNIRLDNFFTGKYKETWRAFVETGDNNKIYDEYTKADNRFIFKPGAGFWVLSTEIVADVKTLTSVETNENDSYAIPVHPGWNIIGNPYQSIVDWQLTLAFNHITGDLWQYNKQFSITDTLKPIQGYYFYNNPTWNLSTLYLPYTGFNQRGQEVAPAVPLNKNASKFVGNLNYMDGHEEQFELVFDENESYNRVHPNLDFAKRGMVVFDKENEEVAYSRFNATLDDATKPYPVQFKAKVGNKVTWSAKTQSLPSDLYMLLVNKTTQITHLISVNDALEFVVTEPTSKYEMYLGSQMQLQEIKEALAPQAFELYNNYPNPFNPSTTIRYALPNTISVKLEVYDVIGRRVATLINGVQQAGYHAINWNATNLSSGVYFYRIQAGSFVKTQKMSLVK